MNTEYADRTTGLYELLKRRGKKLFEILTTPDRSAKPKTAGMFGGSLVSQDFESRGKKHSHR
ncbi:MAG: hypothetical protein V4713_18130 [Pseudomonadota bacterium]